MKELKNLKLALKYAIRKDRELERETKEWWEAELINLLSKIMVDFGLSKKERVALYAEAKREIEKERYFEWV